MENINKGTALQLLHQLTGLRLSHVRKLDPYELYEFLFGAYEVTWQQEPQREKTKRVHFTYCLHILCKLKVCGTNLTGWSTDEQLQSACKQLIGSEVTDVSIGKCNRLKLSFPQGEVRIYPYDDGDEAWRFFSKDPQQPHLVAYFNGMELVGLSS